jgi:hypothetical protein
MCALVLLLLLSCSLQVAQTIATMVCKCESSGSCNCGSSCDCSEDCEYAPELAGSCTCICTNAAQHCSHLLCAIYCTGSAWMSSSARHIIIAIHVSGRLMALYACVGLCQWGCIHAVHSLRKESVGSISHGCAVQHH